MRPSLHTLVPPCGSTKLKDSERSKGAAGVSVAHKNKEKKIKIIMDEP